MTVESGQVGETGEVEQTSELSLREELAKNLADLKADAETVEFTEKPAAKPVEKPEVEAKTETTPAASFSYPTASRPGDGRASSFSRTVVR